MADNRYFYMSDIDCTITVEYATRKEMLELIDNYVENCKIRDEMIANNNPNAYLYDMSQETFTILYKDGTIEYIDEDFDGHHVKRQHIESIINENSSTVMVYGHFGLNECGVAEPTFNDEIDESLKEVDTDDYTESDNTNETTKTESNTTDTIELIQNIINDINIGLKTDYFEKVRKGVKRLCYLIDENHKCIIGFTNVKHTFDVTITNVENGYYFVEKGNNFWIRKPFEFAELLFYKLHNHDIILKHYGVFKRE